MSKAKFVSPKGTAEWPWLCNPDTRYDSDGVYKTNLMVSKDDAKDIMSKAKQIFIEEFGDKSVSKAKWPFEVDEQSGGVRLKAKSAKKPVLYDAKGQVIKEDLNIGNGSALKISGTMSTYNAGGNTGVTMYINAVQVIDLVEFGGAAFEPVEDGYVHSTPEQSQSADASFDF